VAVQALGGLFDVGKAEHEIPLRAALSGRQAIFHAFGGRAR
jgi:hypothetical protein